jgi:hypothetical protein
MYSYPGFTIDNILCCFTKPQIGNETYVKNIHSESLDILVQPSNFKIWINGDFETYAIKMISDYSTNVGTNYFYVNKNNILQPISSQELIDKIKEKEQNENIWFDIISLSQLIYPSPTNKCNDKPDLTNRYNLNGPCDNQENSKYFGYGANGIPCCFDERRNDIITKNKKDFDLTSTYKKQANKQLKNLQIGDLSKELDILFNKILNNKGLLHYRIGVLQNNNSFLNAVLLGIKRNFNLNGIINFKQLLNEFLDNNPEEFLKLNDGYISLKYKSINNYKKYLNNNKNYIIWNDFIDLLEKALRINIIILEEDISKNEIKMVCRPNKKFVSNSSLILFKTKYEQVNSYIKNKDSFELIIRINEKASIKDKIITNFSQNSDTIKFLLEYYSKTCTKKNVYPDNYPYIPLLNYQNLITDLNLKIKYQIVSKLNKCSLVMTENGCLFPIIERGLIDNIEKISFIDFINTAKVTTESDFDKFIKQSWNGDSRWRRSELNEIIEKFNLPKNPGQSNKEVYNIIFNYLGSKDILPFRPLNAFIEFFKLIDNGTKIVGLLPTHNNKIGGIMTNFGYILPYAKIENENGYNLPYLDFIYYLTDIDYTNNSNNAYTDYINYKDNINKDLYKTKLTLSSFINKSPEIKIKIEKLIKNIKIERYTKIININKIFNDIFENKFINDNYYQFIFNIISNEIINDNKENLLINGIVVENNDIDNIIKRDNESILLNIDDIYKWISTHKNN